MKATELLKRQHKEVKKLFQQVSRTQGGEGRRELLDQIGQKLAMHSKIEERIFYPAVRNIGSKKAEELVHEALEEHHVVNLVLAELPRVDPEDERFEAKMTVLQELVEHHADEEEEEMFKLAEKLGAEDLEELGEQMAAESGDHKRR